MGLGIAHEVMGRVCAGGRMVGGFVQRCMARGYAQAGCVLCRDVWCVFMRAARARFAQAHQEEPLPRLPLR